MRKRRLVLSEEWSDDEMEAVTLNRASSAEEEFQWSWKREAVQKTNMNIKLPFFSRRGIVDEIAKELKLIGEGVYEEFLNSCFGSLVRFDTQGSSCKSVFRRLLAHEVVKANASPDELWFRVGGRFIRFSKYEYALVTGLSFGPTTFDPSAEHHPPEGGLFLRYYQGQMLKMDALRRDFMKGVFRESPADALKVAKLLIVYFLLVGRDGSKKFIDEWAWTLIEDSDRWETFVWGKYTYQILLNYLQLVPTQLTRPRVSSYLVCGYVWAFLIWAFEAIPELGNTCGVHTSDDVLPRGIRWRFPKTQVDVQEFRDRQMEVRSTLEPSAEEQRQKYWEHIHDELQSGVCYVHPVKKKKPSINPSSRDVLPVFTNRSCSTSENPVEFKKKCKRTDPSASHKNANKKLSEHECGSRDEMTSDLQKKLSALVRGELPVLVRQELPSVIHLALRDFFSQRDHAVGGTSRSMPVARPTDENPSLSLDSEPELSDVAVDQAGQNKLLFELNEKINELKNKNLENERLVGVFQEKYKHFDTMVVEMGKEIVELRHEKSAAIRTVEKLRLKQLEADKVVEELKRKNLEAKESNNDKADISLENLSPKTTKIEATSEEGVILDRNFKGEKCSSGNGSRMSGLSKKGDRNSAKLWTREGDDDAHAVKTSHGSQSRDNRPQSECNVTVKENEHREPQASDAKCEGNNTTELNGLSDEASTDYSDESCTDSRMDDLIVSLWSKNHSRKWTYEADMLRDFQQDEQLCMNAVCALYRQHVVARKSNAHPKTGGFGPVDSVSGCALAEYLIDGDGDLRLRKSVSEVKNERPDVIGRCRKLATIYVDKLFEMHCTADDPFFGQ